MRINTRVLFLLAIVTMILSSCGDDVVLMVNDLETGSEYQPATEGQFWTYRIDSTIVTRSGTTVFTEGSSSFIRETLSSSFLSPNGDTTFVLERSISDQEAGPFFSTDLWTLEKTEDRLTRVEENLSFTKMLFPIRVGALWDGNQFDDRIQTPVAQQIVEIYRDWDYEIISNTATTEVNGVTYDNVLVVQQANFETALELRRSTEWYAPNIGLIRREMEIFDTQCIDPACQSQPWLDKAEAGFQLVQTLVDFN